MARGSVVGAVVIGVGGLAWAWSAWRSPDPGCDRWADSAAQLWDPSARQSAAPAVVRGLDAYAAAWTSARAEICDGDDVDRVRTGLSCLQERAAALAAFVDAAVDSDPAILPGLAQCTAEGPDPDDVPFTMLAHATLVRGDLARARVLAELGAHDEALVAAAAAHDGAKALALPGLMARALVERGIVLRMAGRRDEASTLLQRAFFAANAAGREDLAARAMEEQSALWP